MDVIRYFATLCQPNVRGDNLAAETIGDKVAVFHPGTAAHPFFQAPLLTKAGWRRFADGVVLALKGKCAGAAGHPRLARTVRREDHIQPVAARSVFLYCCVEILDNDRPAHA